MELLGNIYRRPRRTFLLRKAEQKRLLLTLPDLLGYGDLTFNALLHTVSTFCSDRNRTMQSFEQQQKPQTADVPFYLHNCMFLTFTGHTVLAGGEQNQERQLGADEAFAGPGRRGKNQVGHGVGGGVDPPQAGAAQALPTRDGLQTLQPGKQLSLRKERHTGAPHLAAAALLPVLVGEALDELQRAAVCQQVQRTLAFVVGVVDVGAFLRQKAGDGGAHAQLAVSQKA